MVSINSPSGFRDFIQDEAKRRFQLMAMIAEVYQSFGFSPLETPAVETLDVLLGGGGGEENEKLIFKILKRGGKLEDALAATGRISEEQLAEFGLRFDLTLPLSRAVALHRNEIRLPWKVFHIGPVWRAERPQKGRFREFIQCDVDIVGAKGIGVEIEVIQAVVHAVQRVGAPQFELRLNDRRLIEALATHFGFGGDKLPQFAVLLDKKDKLDLTAWLQQWRELAGQDLSQDFLKFLEGELTLDFAESIHSDATLSLRKLIDTLSALQLPLSRIQFDPSLVRGMGYYTGAVFELRHASAGYSFGGGGRYDQLIGRFCGQEIPACGFSIGFERLALLLADAEKKFELNADLVFFPLFNEALRTRILQLAQVLRQAGMRVDVYPDQAKLKNQFKFASDSGYRWTLIAGEEELSSGVLKLKDFQTGVEVPIELSQMIQGLRDQGVKCKA